MTISAGAGPRRRPVKRIIEQMEPIGSAPVMTIGMREIPTNHGYSLTSVGNPGVWRWQFRIGDLLRSGKAEARLPLLAARRVQLKIDRELKHTARGPILTRGRWADAMRLSISPTATSGWRATTTPMRVLVTICNLK